MSSSGWDSRFWASTRGRIVLLLRRAGRTVNELAEALGLSDNAVRAHLANLERDGLVRHSGMRRSQGKPNHLYDLTPKTEQLFPKPYGPILGQVLDVLRDRLPPEVREEVVREVGHRVAAPHRSDVSAPQLRERMQQALAVLSELGGLAEVEEHDGKLFIRSFDCPLAVAVVGHPELCWLVETLLADLIGVPVRERCQRGTSPRCYFEMPAVKG